MPRPQRSELPNNMTPAVKNDAEELWLAPLFSAARPFESRRGSSGSRLIWHPQVQYLMGNRICVFYRIRVHRVSLAEVESSIEAMVTAAGISTFTIFALLGDWDVLVRVWARAEQHKKLLERLNADRFVREDVSEFYVDNLIYVWKQPVRDITLRDIAKSRELVIQATNENSKDAALRQLLNDGLLIALPPRPAARITYFVSLVPLPGQSFSRAFYSDLATRFREAGHQWLTVMDGKGFSSCILRLSAAQFSDIYTVVSTIIADVSKQYQAHSETYLPAIEPSVERDDLDLSGELSTELRELAALLGTDVDADMAKSLNRCSPDEKRDLEMVYRNYAHTLLSGDLEDVFLSVLSLRINGPSEDLATSLMLLSLVEIRMRRYWLEAIESSLASGGVVGMDGHIDVVEALQSYSIEFDLCVDLVAPLSELMPELSEPFVHFLGTDWRRRLVDFSHRLRRPVKSGEAFFPEYSDEFLRNWSELSILACDVCVLYAELLSGEARHDA